ncbi:MAG: hypothetical protein KC560_17795, partial [Myxococcales bacterium]|nr:hypothetical protein [Myxococcales bacterium]
SADARRAHVLREAAASTVVLEPDARWRAAPLHRFARLHPVASVAALREAVAPIARFLSTIAVAGIGDAEAREALAGLGGHRLCAPGEMQSPPLAWRRDGLGLFAPLVDAAPAPG